MRSPRYDRAKKRLMVRYGLEKPDRMAFTKNISMTGIHIQTNNVVHPGRLIQIEIKFPDRTFVLAGRVIWAKRVPFELAHKLHCGMGAQFVDPGEEWETFFSNWREGKT